ncbi:MAG: protein-L-isoaspartate(D-aspartate) O-methyltransferase [Thermodesulfobacteriota bacterium]
MSELYLQARRKMVQEQLVPRGISDPGVLGAMGRVPRHLFVDTEFKSMAYGDYPLPLSHGQTISQPYIVALMTQALELTGREKALEVGTGSGYQTAILAELSAQVYTVERIEPLLEQARRLLAELGYRNITSQAFDGTLGWPEFAPYEAVIVTAAAPGLPGPLLDQLADGGRLVIPLGDAAAQDLVRITKKGQEIEQTHLCGCRFVKLIGVHGWKA